MYIEIDTIIYMYKGWMKMNAKMKNRFLFVIFSLLIGAIAGAIICIFFKIMNMSIEVLWVTIPNNIKIPFYTIILCTIGGLIIGLWQKKFGDYPEELDTVMKKVKQDGGYQYNNIPGMCVSALLPLIFGGSVGPEAGLTGVIAGLCTWVGDKTKKIFNQMKELTQIGISATLGTIFHSPLFGFIEPIESETENTTLPKTSKIVVYFLSILGALGIFLLLGNAFGGSSGIPKFEDIQISTKEWIYIIPLALIGTISGFIYHISNKITKKIVKPIQKYTVIKSVIAGLTLGIVGTILPFTMFSGEHQMQDVMSNWSSIGATILLLTGIIKLIITNTCIIMGFKGGHFFPVIFSGICIGYAFGIFLGINPVFSVIIITTALVSCIMRKPLATVLLLMICFPIEAFLPMIIAAMIGSIITVPNILKEDNKEQKKVD